LIFLVALLSPASILPQPPGAAATAIPVENFAVENRRTIEVLEGLASATHVVISVSGDLIGSDNKLISIEANRRPLGQILDSICAQDPRYRWQGSGRGEIAVTVGHQTIGLLNVIIKSLRLNHLNAPEAVILISRLPEVKAWSEHTGCRVGETITMGWRQESWDLDMEVNNKPLSSILNELSARNKTYFWSAVKISDAPCYIDLNP
jgi:hypothetical protein